MPQIKFQNDKYKRARGGYSRLLEISCEKCGAILCRYQKDGPGPLKRMYLDRIFNAPALSNPKKLAGLMCNKCKSALGVGYIYEKENRSAYRLFVGAVTKKIVKAK